jgi:hypothetical protein
MKFLFVTLTALFSLFNTKSFADDVKITPVVLESFNSSFENAKEVKWSFSESFYKADFCYDGQYIAAFFNTEGEMVAVTKNISSSQLPVTLQKNLKKEYQSYWISDLFELSDESSTSYYITLEDADSKVVLKSSGTSGWTTYKKIRKS